MIATVDDLQLYLGASSIDAARATLLLELAEDECLSVVSPLPTNAKRVVLSAATRAYTNPQAVTTESTGPFQVGRPWAGIYLTKAERAALRRGTDSGGAFSVDPTPADAGPLGSWPQIPNSPLDTTDTFPYFDRP